MRFGPIAAAPVCLGRPTRHSARSIAAASIVALGWLISSATFAPAQTVRHDFPVTDESVNVMTVVGNTLYVGGDFSRIGPPTGSGVPIDTATALPVAGFPCVEGVVERVIADGAGGWYIGGDFSSVGGASRTRLAHILSDLSVSGWNPGANGTVTALALVGGVVYAGGAFTEVGGAPRNRLAAVDAVTGAPLSWDPDANDRVNDLEVSEGAVYVGGLFTTVGGVTRNRLAAIDALDGALLPWNPNANAEVLTLAIGTNVVFVGGHFTNVGGQPRSRVAALDHDGLATGWNPGVTVVVGPVLVRTLTVADDVVYIGGMFNRIGGQVRIDLGAVDANTGTPTSWVANVHSGGRVNAIAVGPSVVYVGGLFNQVGGQARKFLAAVDRASGQIRPWQPNVNGHVSDLAISGDRVYAGGVFSLVGGVHRRGLAALDIPSGAVTEWDPALDGNVMAMVARGGSLYVGGVFSTVGPTARRGLAEIDRATGLATAWNPDPYRPGAPAAYLNTLAVSEDVVYFGGGFDRVGGISGTTRAGLAAVDRTTGSVTGWNPSPTGGSPEIYSLVAGASTLYVGGWFTGVGGQSRSNVAELDADGLATSWNPGADQSVYSIASAGGSVYIAGDFAIAGTAPRNHLAELDASTGTATGWSPDANGIVNAVLPADGVVYAAGMFDQIGDAPRTLVAALDPSSGLATAWNLSVGPIVWLADVLHASMNGVASAGGEVFLGGTFGSLGTLRRHYLGAASSANVGVPNVPGVEAWLRATPNPFVGSTSIHYALPRAASVTLEFFDVAGRAVATPIRNRWHEAGPHALRVEGDALPAGLYLLRLRAGGEVVMTKVVRTR